jgi:hypothetical protein
VTVKGQATFRNEWPAEAKMQTGACGRFENRVDLTRSEHIFGPGVDLFGIFARK